MTACTPHDCRSPLRSTPSPSCSRAEGTCCLWLLSAAARRPSRAQEAENAALRASGERVDAVLERMRASDREREEPEALWEEVLYRWSLYSGARSYRRMCGTMRRQHRRKRRCAARVVVSRDVVKTSQIKPSESEHRVRSGTPLAFSTLFTAQSRLTLDAAIPDLLYINPRPQSPRRVILHICFQSERNKCTAWTTKPHEQTNNSYTVDGRYAHQTWL